MPKLAKWFDVICIHVPALQPAPGSHRPQACNKHHVRQQPARVVGTDQLQRLIAGLDYFRSAQLVRYPDCDIVSTRE
jgi:hypothetical protein